LLQLIQENEQVLTADCLKQVADELRHPNPEMIIEGGLQILKRTRRKDYHYSCCLK